jgi:hypothetical protein
LAAGTSARIAVRGFRLLYLIVIRVFGWLACFAWLVPVLAAAGACSAVPWWPAVAPRARRRLDGVTEIMETAARAPGSGRGARAPGPRVMTR